MRRNGRRFEKKYLAQGVAGKVQKTVGRDDQGSRHASARYQKKSKWRGVTKSQKERIPTYRRHDLQKRFGLPYTRNRSAEEKCLVQQIPLLHDARRSCREENVGQPKEVNNATA